VKVLAACGAPVWLAAVLAMGSVQAGPFAFAGFRRNMDLAILLDRYPRSSHELTPGAGARHRTSQEDEKAWMREFFHSRASGSYVLRLAPKESHNHLYYVQAWIQDGVTERLWLSLELPVEWVKGGASTQSNEARYPACHGVLNALVDTYGRPVTLPPSWEKAVESFSYEWMQGSDTMTLECGQYRGRKAVFAMGVTMARSGR
jgi:hypothetical protein